MSVPAATARYVIAADDRTGSAIKSVLRGFRDIDKNVRGTVKTLNSVLGIFIGVQLAQGLRKVIDATAQSTEGSKGFAVALNQVRDAARDLLAAKSGLPEATRNMQELREILRDPSLVAAADAVTSTLIKEFTDAAKAIGQTVAGLRELAVQRGLVDPKTDQERLDRNEREIAELEARREQLRRQPQGRILKGDYAFDISASRNQIAAIDQAIARREAENELIRNFRSFSPDIKAPDFDFITKEQADEAERAAKEFQKLSDEIVKGVSDSAIETKDILDRVTEDTIETQSNYLGGYQQVFDQHMEELSRIGEVRLNEMSVYAEEAARNMQDAFADFLFDPFEGGLKGMVTGFINAIRRMVAEAAAAKIFEQSGLGDFIGGLFGGSGSSFSNVGSGAALNNAVLGLATGTDYVPRDGLAYLHKGEAVVPASQNRMPSVTINNNIDARGATVELIDRLPAVLKANNEAVVQRVQEMNSRRPPPSRR